MQPIASSADDLRTTGHGAPPTATEFDGAAVVWRLALDGGLTPEQASDVCFVTLQEYDPEPAPMGSFIGRGPGWLLRTALEQCTVARHLAADAPPRRARADDAAVPS